MKKIYEKPELTLLRLETEDIITLSSGGSITDSKLPTVDFTELY